MCRKRTDETTTLPALCPEGKGNLHGHLAQKCDRGNDAWASSSRNLGVLFFFRNSRSSTLRVCWPLPDYKINVVYRGSLFPFSPPVTFYACPGAMLARTRNSSGNNVDNNPRELTVHADNLTAGAVAYSAEHQHRQ